MTGALSIQPGREEFARLAAAAPFVPLMAEFIADNETPVGAFQKLLDEDASLGGEDGGASFLLESAEQAEGIGRYSFMGIRPLATWELRGEEIRVARAGAEAPETTIVPPGRDPLKFLAEEMARHRPAQIAALAGVPFVGGAVGWLGYEMARWFEPTLPPPPPDALGLPDALFLLTDVLLVFDHRHRRLRVIVHARTGPGVDADLAHGEAAARLRRLARRLEAPSRLRAARPWPGAAGEPSFTSNTTREEYEAMVVRCQEHIRAGDIFQCVPSQRFEAPFTGSPLALYRALRLVNPSPYMFLLRFARGGPAFVGSSPEVHVRALGGRVEIRPIAGTRRRGATPEEDAALAAELLADPKERAEHVMLVDLARNDAGRVARFGTVRVTDFARVERYSHVMHLVSDVTGELRPGTGALEVLRATFPAGTVTGAPKVRAMEIIASLEKSRRGFYAGAVCYLGHDGSLDSCIALRSVVLQDGRAHVQAGAGVVADSVPASEHQETVNKAAAVLRAVELAREMEE